MDRAEAVYVPDGDQRFVPTEIARGPWDPEAQHGGPPAALLARAFERFDSPRPMRVARMNVDFLGPIPLAPLEVDVEISRPGGRVQMLDGSIRSEGRTVVRARAVRIRTDQDLIEELPEPLSPPPPPEAGESGRPPFPSDIAVFHLHGVEFRSMGDRPPALGPARAWLRLRVPLVAGEEPSPLMRAAAAADFGNGVAPALDHRHYVYINPDMSLMLNRYPEGEWVGLDSVTWAESDGIGLADSALYDRHGRIGRALQTLYLDRRPPE